MYVLYRKPRVICISNSDMVYILSPFVFKCLRCAIALMLPLFAFFYMVIGVGSLPALGLLGDLVKTLGCLITIILGMISSLIDLFMFRVKLYCSLQDLQASLIPSHD